MIELFGIKLTYDVLFAFVLFLSSEYIGANPKIKASSISQLIIQAAQTLKPFRKEDDKIARIKAQIAAIEKELKS